MPAGLRSRKDAEIRPRISTKAPKSSKINVKSFEKRKDFERKGGEEEKANKTRGGRKLRLDDVVSDRKLYDGEAGRKRRRNDDDKKVIVSQSKPPKWNMGHRNGKDFDEDDCIEETMRRGEERGNKRRGDDNKIISKSKPPKWKMGLRNLDEDNYDEETISSHKERKKLDLGGKKGNVVKCMESEEQVDETAEKKQFRFQTRVLEKTGKKIRGHKKVLDEKSEATEAPPKSRKRVIKIDPYDISNKRLDDGIPSSEKVVAAEVEISKNAQFRAIQPSPSILSFVEDNLLGRRRMIELQNAGYNVKLSAPLDNIPFSNSSERERIEENVFRNKLEFFAAAKISSSFPPPIIPEIAFAGRSNVGKSSLLNALTRQWGVVRTSDKPGYTQTINFFRLASKLCLVDLPGYGFAYAKEEVKDAWEELVKEYVSTRVGLKRVCLLIDTKWGMKPRDHELIDLMERSQTPYQIVLTKTDAVFPIDVARRAMQVQEILKAHNSIVKPVTMVSSKTGAGIRNLRTVLAKIARFAKP